MEQKIKQTNQIIRSVGRRVGNVNRIYIVFLGNILMMTRRRYAERRENENRFVRLNRAILTVSCTRERAYKQ